MLRGRKQDTIKRFFFGKKFWNGQRWPLPQREIKACDVDPRQVKPVVEAVVVGIGLEQTVVPRFELPAQHQVQFEMQMCAHLIQPFAGMSHHAKLIELLHPLPNVHLD